MQLAVFEDEELRKGLKYWHGRKPSLGGGDPIQTREDLLNALAVITSGERDFHQYHGVTGINRERHI